MPDTPYALLSDHVHQATGMVAMQAGCKIPEALDRLRIRARADDQALEDLAMDVIDHIITFYV